MHLDGFNLSLGADHDLQEVISRLLRPAPAPSVPEIRLLTAHPGSGLGRLGLAAPPYWAHSWGGGLALARYVLDHPAVVRGRKVLDIGCGGGVVGIAAALAGAAQVTAVDVDRFAVCAARLNAEANGVPVEVRQGDLTAGPPLDVELALAGDVFYEPQVADRMAGFFGRCVAAGTTVLVGDPGRRDLPLDRLRLLARVEVPDFGEAAGAGAVYAFDA